MKFDENGNRVPRVTPQEKELAIAKARMEKNADIQAQNLVDNVVEAVAVSEIEGFAITPKVSQQFRNKIESRKPILRAKLGSGLYVANPHQLQKVLRKFAKVMEMEI